jgi:hypothetical protein
MHIFQWLKFRAEGIFIAFNRRVSALRQDLPAFPGS